MLDGVRIASSGIQFRTVFLVTSLTLALLVGQILSEAAWRTRTGQEGGLHDAARTASILASSLETGFGRLDVDKLEQVLSNFRTRSEISGVSVVDSTLTILIDGDPQTPSAAGFDIPVIHIEAQRRQRPVEEIIDGRVRVAEPLYRGDAVIGSVMIEYPTLQWFENLGPILRSSLTTTLPILATFLLFAVGLAGQVANPLNRMSVSAREVGEGSLDGDQPLEGPREVRQLAASFNTMVGNLRNNIEKIHRIAYVDRVTQLPNRQYFDAEMSRAIHRAERSGRTGALLFVDLDGFKRVNDTLGHDTGDRLLAAFSERIRSIVRADDTVSWQSPVQEAEPVAGKAGASRQFLARLGGDEFTILLAEIREEMDAALVARRILTATQRPFEFDGTEVRIGASIGIATFPRNGTTCHQVLKCADMAMYLAKEEGKNTFRFYSEELNERANRKVALEAELRRALEKRQLALHYQPKLACPDGRLVSAEALLRWNHSERGLVSPGEFIRVAEEAGLMVPIGEFVLRQACRDLAILQAQGLSVPISINIARQQFELPDFPETVLRIAAAEGIACESIEIEITESMATANPGRTLAHALKLRRAGIRLAIDDFGTGMSSLQQLSRLPVTALKIDKSFVQMMSEDEGGHAERTVRAILAMAASLNCDTIAEGVETAAQLAFLRSCGCTFAQGYLLGRPMPLEELIDWQPDQRVFSLTATDTAPLHPRTRTRQAG